MTGQQYYYEGYPPNGGNGSANVNGNGSLRPRPFTVEEAIPQSPFSSILPYDTGTRSNYLQSSHFTPTTTPHIFDEQILFFTTSV